MSFNKSKKQIPWFKGKTKKKLKVVSLEEYKKIKVPKNKMPKGYVNRSLFKELYCQYVLGIIVRYEKDHLKDLECIRKYYFEKKYNDYGELNDKKLWQRENEKLMKEQQ